MFYYSLNSFLKNKFGEKVYRISIDAGFTCPNRDGSKGYGGCVYCGESGARARYVNPSLSVREQVRKGIETVGKRYAVKRFLAYFQAYTNTYGEVGELYRLYKSALEFPEICGIAIGTRPDCIDEEKVHMLEHLAEETFVIVEYGAQSMHDSTLEKINRAHSVADTARAVRLTVKSGRIHAAAHLIFGLPDENESDMIESVSALLSLGINGFKFHHLFIEKFTAMERDYRAGKILLMEREEYVDILVKVISILPADTVIHRLFGGSRADKLVAPLWTLDKQMNHEILRNRLMEKGITQGMDRREILCGGSRRLPCQE
jgi:hypothetical protein